MELEKIIDELPENCNCENLNINDIAAENRQVRFYDTVNDTVQGGILLTDGSLICGCCGGWIEEDDICYNKEEAVRDEKYYVFHIYRTWIDISDGIVGD